MLRSALAHVSQLLARRRAHRELDEELQFHLEMETRANIERGMEPAEAQRRAVIDIGGVQQTRESVLDLRSTFFDRLLIDVRYAFRRWRRERGLAAACVLTFAISVGLATAIYSLADAVLLRPFPFTHAERLLTVFRVQDGLDFGPLPLAEFEALSANASAIESVGGFTRADFILSGTRGARWTGAFEVTTNFFEVLGVPLLHGRSFLPTDSLPGAERVVVLGPTAWRSAFDSNPSIVGQLVSLRTDGEGTQPLPYRVVGIVATDVEIYYPRRVSAEVYVPHIRHDDDVTMPLFITIAKRRPEVTNDEAVLQVRAIVEAAGREHRTAFASGTARVTSLHDELVGRTTPAFALMAAAAVLLLLTGCANVANLLLASTVRRARESATRLALGCGPGRLLRQLLTEHVVLALFGLVGGTALALWLTAGLKRLAPATLPRAESITVSPAALAVAAGLTLCVWLVSGALPAALTVWRGASAPLQPDALRPAKDAPRVRRSLILVQTMLTVMLLGAASLLANSLWHLDSVQSGLDTERVYSGALVLPEWWTKGAPDLALTQALVERLRTQPDIESVSIASLQPYTFAVLTPIGLAEQRDGSVKSLVAGADPQLLGLLRIPLLHGRVFTKADATNPHVVIVNDTLARRISSTNPLGQRLSIGGEWREVIGVVGDVTELGELKAGVIRMEGLSRLALPAAYVPIATLDESGRYLLCKFARTPRDAASVLSSHLHAVDPGLAILNGAWLSDRAARASAEVRFCTTTVSLIALAALVLGSIGISATLAYAVSCRTRELGIRSALGASPARLLWMVTGEACVATLLASLAGIGGVVAGMRWLRAFLFQPESTPAWPLGAAVLLLVAVAIAAAWIPARAAITVDARRALKAEG